MNSSSSTAIPQWYCVRTQTKREQVAARSLRELDGVEVFSPQLRYPKMTRRGKVMWQEALFPGYILAKFSLDENERAVKSAYGVSNLVNFGGKVPAVAEAIVESLRAEWTRRSTSNNECVALEATVEINQEIEVAVGPFHGMSGVVTEILPGAQRVNLLMEMMGGTQIVEMDLASLLLPRAKPTFVLDP